MIDYEDATRALDDHEEEVIHLCAIVTRQIVEAFGAPAAHEVLRMLYVKQETWERMPPEFWSGGD